MTREQMLKKGLMGGLATLTAIFLPVPAKAAEALRQEAIEGLPVPDEKYTETNLLVILLSMTDEELMVTLMSLPNQDLSKLGMWYPSLCNRVADVARKWEAIPALMEWKKEMRQYLPQGE